MTEMQIPDVTKYLILVEGTPQDQNYSAWSPDVLGCVSVGDTVAETVANMREALEFHLESMARDGDPIPTPSGPGGVFVQADASLLAA